MAKVVLREIYSFKSISEETRKASKRKFGRDFLGGPVAKTLCSQCKGLGSNLWSGN